MLAVRMYGVDDTRLENVETPHAKYGEIVIKIAAAVICGTDVRMITGGAKGIDSEHPKILGHEFAGTVFEIGEGVEGYHLGQRVAFAPNFGCGICNNCVKGNGHLCADYKATGINIDGAFAEYCLIPAQAVRSGNICPIDDNISFEQAAINEPLSCVYNGFEHADIHPGDVVLVVGAGPIGIMHCALALMAGAVVYLNDISKDRLEEAKKLYPKLNLLYNIDDIMELTDFVGADAIITACPVPSVQSKAIELAAVGGRVIFFGGIAAKNEPVPIDTNLIHYKQLIVSGTTRASLYQYRRTLQFISSGVLDVSPLISKRLSLKDFSEGLDLAKRGIGLKNVIIME